MLDSLAGFNVLGTHTVDTHNVILQKEGKQAFSYVTRMNNFPNIFSTDDLDTQNVNPGRRRQSAILVNYINQLFLQLISFRSQVLKFQGF